MDNKDSTTGFSKLSEPFKALIGNQELNYQILDLLPVPIEIFAPDGTAMFGNRALLELLNIPDMNLFVGHYNLKHDPICLSILGQELVDRIFNGETCSFADFPAPVQESVDCGIIKEKPAEAMTMDLFALPIWDGNTFTCTITFFTVKNMYHGRTDVAKAQKYIDEHWQDKFDIDKIAQSVNLSSRHLRRIFKEVTGSTPIEYYQNVKIEKIKEKLLDESLSVEKAFEACCVSSRGSYLSLFKDKTGMNPSEYRKKNTSI